MSRPRFGGSVRQLTEVLAPFVTSVLWCKYPEDGAVDGMQLKEHAALLGALHGLQSNLSFRDASVKQSFMELAASNESIRTFEWKNDELSEWVVACSKRLRNMCRHTAQALGKSSQAEWCKAIRSHCKSDGSDEKRSEYYYGWDCDLGT
eukprot:1289230-Alexandrium_andersonii.AAC.1